jgi:hypothetical protein
MHRRRDRSEQGREEGKNRSQPTRVHAVVAFCNASFHLLYYIRDAPRVLFNPDAKSPPVEVDPAFASKILPQSSNLCKQLQQTAARHLPSLSHRIAGCGTLVHVRSVLYFRSV